MKLIKIKCVDQDLAYGFMNDYKYKIISDNNGGYAFIIKNTEDTPIHKQGGFNSINNAVKEAVKFISEGQIDKSTVLEKADIFKSKAQQKYLFARQPKIAKEFAEKTPKSAYKKLPEHVKK